MKRGRKGDGSVTQKPNGKWLAKVPMGKKPGGNTSYCSKTCKSRSEAHKSRTKMIQERENRSLVAGPRQSLKQYSTEVLFNHNDRITDRTRDGYYRNLRKHVYPTLGAKPLKEVRPQEIEALFSQLRLQYSASTVNNVRTALSKIFTVAVRQELMLSNPVARTQKAKRSEFEPTQVRAPWSPEEAKEALEAASDTPMEAFLVLAMQTGMRRGELLGLRWSDFDFEHQTVSIERTIHFESILQRDGSTLRSVVVKPPKTATSRRVNQVSIPVINALRRHQIEQEVARQMAGSVWEDADYVFTNDHGGVLDESNFSKKWKRFLRNNGLRHIRIHDIRHGFATILIEDDPRHLAAVSRALGHSSVGITMDLYAKNARVDTHATARMSEILWPDLGKVESISVTAPANVGSLPPGHRRWN